MSLLPDYHIVYSQRRTLAIVVSKGSVTVRAPVGCHIGQIQQLLSAKQSWISRHLLCQQAQAPLVSWQQRAEILYRGQLLTVTFSRAKKSDVSITTSTLLIKVSQRVTAANLADWHNTLLNRWLYAQAGTCFPDRLAGWANVLGVSFHRLELGQWQRRWGYCTSDGVIGLNWRLIMAPEWVSDYVMVHELAHRLVMDHSPLFWRVVHRNLPDYPQAQAWLSYHQQQLVA
ncbi:M48 family metallopeptidase [Arsukibacterium ikkense]|uniref:M48 family metallopeptidase n=1 Tax=Arsukibacterium ikkense TaxID=336831 RepID=UPI00069BA901|nr:SprT family zinc-dependent metalloprotease [Arsukibacterium ikkense]